MICAIDSYSQLGLVVWLPDLWVVLLNALRMVACWGRRVLAPGGTVSSWIAEPAL